MKVAIYARVSTKDQELLQQIASCQRFCDYKKFEVVDTFTDKMSGAKHARPGYLELIKQLRAFKYEGVVVFRLDRLGRNSRELALLIDELEGKGIKVLSVNESFDTSTAIGRAMREIVCVFAQLEREQIGEATQQRLASLKAAGKKLGRKPASQYHINRVQELQAQGLKAHNIAKRLQLSYGTVYAIVNKRGVYSGIGGNGQKEGLSPIAFS
jgi:DNA invertase Pin-like site-specific DNA recombinase